MCSNQCVRHMCSSFEIPTSRNDNYSTSFPSCLNSTTPSGVTVRHSRPVSRFTSIIQRSGLLRLPSSISLPLNFINSFLDCEFVIRDLIISERSLFYEVDLFVSLRPFTSPNPPWIVASSFEISMSRNDPYSMNRFIVPPRL